MTATATATAPSATPASASPTEQPGATAPATPPTPAATTPPAAEGTPPTATKPGASSAWDEAGDVATPAAAEGAPAPAASEPVDYAALALPEGTSLSDEDLGDLRTFAQEQGLSMAQANALVLREHQLASGLDTVRADAVKAWEAAAKADPEIGGEKYPATIRAAKAAAVQKLGPEIAEWLRESGRFSDPMWLRALARLGAPLVESTGAGHGTPTHSSQPADDRALWRATRGDQRYPLDPK